MVQIRILDATLVVEVHHLFQRPEPAIMHVGSSASDLAQRRRLERTDVFCALCHQIPTEIERIGIPSNTDIVKLLIGEIESGMATCAPGFPSEQFKTTLCGLIQCRFVTALVKLIHGAVTGQHGALKTGDRLPHILNHDLSTKDVMKECPVARNCAHLGHHFIMIGKAVFDWVVERPDGLIFQRVCTAVQNCTLL